MIYRICHFIARVLYRFFFRYEVIGSHNIPEKGPVLLCPNHIHNFDPPFVGAAIDREASFMAKAEAFKIPILSWFLYKFNAFPVKRGASDKRAIRSSLQALQGGKVLIIFPEGTRSKTGKLGKGFTGAGFIALKEECTVVPAAVIGPYRLFRKIKLVIGEPVDISDLRQDRKNKDAPREATNRMMEAIQRLLDQYEA